MIVPEKLDIFCTVETVKPVAITSFLFFYCLIIVLLLAYYCIILMVAMYLNMFYYGYVLYSIFLMTTQTKETTLDRIVKNDVIYDVKSANFVDFIKNDGSLMYSYNSVDEVLKEYPNAIVTSFEKASELRDKTNARVYKVNKPKVVTEKLFNYHLEVLPPSKWGGITSATIDPNDVIIFESFMNPECITDNLYDHLCKIQRCGKSKVTYFLIVADRSTDQTDLLINCYQKLLKLERNRK